MGDTDAKWYSSLADSQDATNIARIVIALAERNVLIEPNGRLPIACNAKRWDWMGQPGEVLWDLPQGIYDSDGVRKKTVFDGVPAEPAPAAPRSGETKETDATMMKLLRDLAVS